MISMLKFTRNFFSPKFSRTIRRMKAKLFIILIKAYKIHLIFTCFFHYLVILTVLSSSGRAQKLSTSKIIHIANNY
jgi:hypothetical protein